MLMIEEYGVVTAAFELGGVSDEVNELLRKGWTLWGSPFVIYEIHEGKKVPTFVQPMVRYKAEGTGATTA